MPNTIANSSWVTKEVGRGFINEITFVRMMNRTYDDQYVQNGAKVGDTVRARLPQRFTVTDGQALQTQALFNETVPITLTNQKNIAFSWSSKEATTNLDDVRARYTQPAAERLANAADVLAFEAVYRDVWNAVGTPGAGPPSTTLTYLTAGVKLTDGAVPQAGRYACIDPLQMATIANASSTLFNPAAVISENYRKGMFGREQLGISEWYQDANRPLHTTGAFTAATPLVNGAGQTGSTININGWAAGATTLKKGDIFTMAGVFSINPGSYVSTGRLQQFVVTADTADAAGVTATLPISPSIITSGALQTVSNSPANGAVVLVWGATSGGALAAAVSPTGMIYTKDAFAFVMADLIRPSAGADASFVRSKEWGISIRMVEQYQILNDQNPSRLDILIGAATVQARFASRVQS